MTAKLKKTLIIGGVILVIIAVIIGIVIVLPSGNDGTTTTTTTTTKKPSESTTTTTTTTKPGGENNGNGGNGGNGGTTSTTKPSTTTTTTTTTTKKPTTTTTTKPSGTTTKPNGGNNPSQHVHTPVVDPAISATCTRIGLTEGSHCSECGETIVEQVEIQPIPHTYDDKYDTTCNICGFVRVAECAHTNTVTIPGKDATCAETGLTDGVKCSKCGTIITAQTVIPKVAHTEVKIPGKAATCTSTGLTDGVKCSTCGEILIQQTTIPESHTESDWIVDKEPTKDQSGSKHIECTACNTIIKTEIISATGSTDLDYELNDDGESYSVSGIGTCKDNDIIIPSTYNGKPVTSIGYSAFRRCTSLTSVTIPDSVTSIGNDAFEYCTSLKEVYYQGTLEDWCKIEFDDSDSNPCYNRANLYINDELLTDAVIPDSVTSIGSDAFRGCTSLTSITIPDSVTGIGYDAFSYCTSLKYNEYDNAYYLGNSSNPYLVLVEAKSQDITSCNINSNTRFIHSYAFYECKSLMSIAIPGSVTSIGVGTFSDCESLASITIPDSVTSIGESAFWGCTSLTSVTIANSVTSIGNSAFKNCTSLKNITVYESNANYKSIDGNLYTKDEKTLVQYAVGKEDTSFVIPDCVTSIGGDAFYYCKSLTSVTIPDSVTSIGYQAFDGCTSLTEIHYNGTKTQWNSISKKRYWNEYTGSYTIYCTDGSISK